ncbi:hypothetical protein CLPU_8c00860 [Gottschalkia purinilytica]|uniref:ABC-2 family transporter protein n=1 Tax=Gottschalkia purinilytica TaxID=1503 RepID=A0A0L0WA36_GOTPU|nr:hypothetical protein [Gottschalkia purinilytica]KNF08321.1 hypothetical protein CLPU_8c00860 [Gottschalkia purinilytica]
MKNSKKKFKDTDFLEVSDEDLMKFIDEINEYSIEVPSQNEINTCIENLRKHVPKKKNLLDILKNITKRIEIDLSYMNKLYWTINILIFLISYLFIITKNISPYGVIVFISPIPLILGFTEIFKGRENGMIELELSFKVSAREIILSRMIILGAFNIALNLVMAIMISRSYTGLNLLKVNIMWLTPFIWVNFVSFMIAKRIRSQYVSFGMIGTWICSILLIFNSPKVVEKFININTGIYILIILVGITLMAIQVKKYIKEGLINFDYHS